MLSYFSESLQEKSGKKFSSPSGTERNRGQQRAADRSFQKTAVLVTLSRAEPPNDDPALTNNSSKSRSDLNSPRRIGHRLRPTERLVRHLSQRTDRELRYRWWHRGMVLMSAHPPTTANRSAIARSLIFKAPEAALGPSASNTRLDRAPAPVAVDRADRRA
jgi:hypothetical protein